VRRFFLFWLISAWSMSNVFAATVLDPASTGGVVALHHALSRLDANRRLLIIGAHPDDEDTSLLALVARGMGGEAAYLSLSRGEGGQNLIGPELGSELGLLRSQELLSARGIDGARQFFTRAFDFGYTRSLEETHGKWPEEALLEDAVRVVRRFKPHVIVSVFPPSARAGHGQHQAAGVVAQQVFEAAADPSFLPELRDEGLAPWQASLFYRSAFFRPVPGNLELPTGATDPASGKTYFQLAMASRSQHRSQDMGVLQDTGPRMTRVVGANPAAESATELFADLDTSLETIADLLAEGDTRSALRDTLSGVGAQVSALRADLVPAKIDALAPRFAALVTELGEATTLAEGAGSDEALPVRQLLEEKVALAGEAWAVASGFVLDATTAEARLVPGRAVELRVTFYNSGTRDASVAPAVELPAGWPAVELDRRSVAAGAVEQWQAELSVPAHAAATVPYFRVHARQGDLYDWSQAAPEVRGEPFDAPVATVGFEVTAAETTAILSREVVHRYRDQAVGERRAPLRVVPAVEIAVTPERLVWPLAAGDRRVVRVNLAKNVPDEVAGQVRVAVPSGWPAIDPVDFRLEASRDGLAVEVELRRAPGASGDEEQISFEAVLADGPSSAAAYPRVEYPHIRPVPYPRAAVVSVRSVDLETPQLARVGYVRGASDRVPESLLEVGLPLELLSSQALLDARPEALAEYDAIVIGSRAYEADPRLGEANQQLLDYAEAGGLLLVQYQQYAFVRGGYAPFDLQIGRPHDRITDEGAPVELLQPDHPVFQTPHRIGPDDWEGWVQERGLYFARTWDESFTPLLRLTDPEMPPQEGGLLVAPLGSGTYVYSGLAFFRQLPAGVPGAFRLFFNLLALGA
jgi:LmbE family N-acetylglucosaminyl deacetylase